MSLQSGGGHDQRAARDVIIKIAEIADVCVMSQIPGQRPIIDARADNLDECIPALRPVKCQFINAFEQSKNILVRVRVDIGVGDVRGVSTVQLLRLPIQVQKRKGEHARDSDFNDLCRTAQQLTRAHAGDKNESVIKSEQSPRRLVGDEHVNERQNQRVQGDKAHEGWIRAVFVFI